MSVLNTLNLILESKLARYALFLTLLLAIFSVTFQPLVTGIAGAFSLLVVVDMIYVPAIMFHIRKNGRFYLVFDALQKLMTLVILFFIMTKFYSIITFNLEYKIAFIVAFLYILNYNFDINKELLSDIKILKMKKDHAGEGYSKEAIELLEGIHAEDDKRSNKSFLNKVSDMITKYIFNAHFQFGTLRAIVLRDKEYIDATESISLEWGMKEVASKMTFREIVKNNYNRVIVDALIVVMMWVLVF